MFLGTPSLSLHIGDGCCPALGNKPLATRACTADRPHPGRPRVPKGAAQHRSLLQRHQLEKVCVGLRDPNAELAPGQSRETRRVGIDNGPQGRAPVGVSPVKSLAKCVQEGSGKALLFCPPMKAIEQDPAEALAAIFRCHPHRRNAAERHQHASNAHVHVKEKRMGDNAAGPSKDEKSLAAASRIAAKVRAALVVSAAIRECRGVDPNEVAQVRVDREARRTRRAEGERLGIA